MRTKLLPIFLIVVFFSSVSLIYGEDLSYKWKFFPGDADLKDLEKSSFISARTLLSRGYRSANPRIPGKEGWFLFEVEKPLDANALYFIHFKEGPVIKNVYFNGQDISGCCGKGINRAGGRNWNIFGDWYFLPEAMWKEGANDIYVRAWDVKFLNDNVFGEVYLQKSGIYRRLKAEGNFNTFSYDRWEGSLHITNISPAGIRFEALYLPVDYYGRVLPHAGQVFVELEKQKSYNLRLPVEDIRTHKFVCTLKNGEDEFNVTVYVLPPYKETSVRKEWCLDTPDTKNSFRGYFWEVLKWKKDAPLQFPPPQDGWERFAVPSAYREKLEEVHSIWYRTVFKVDGIRRDKIYRLFFESIFEDGIIYLNGEKAGEHRQSDIPFYVDVTGLIKEGENELLVGITGWTANLKPEIPLPVLGVTKGVAAGSLIRPGWPRGVYYLGITKSVYLQEVPKVRVENVLIRTWLSRGELELVLKLANQERTSRRVTVAPSVFFEGVKEKEFMPVAVTVPAGQTMEKTVKYRWKPQKLWTPAGTNLYQMKIALKKGAVTVDENEFRFGAREWSWDGDRFFLNGKPFNLYAAYAPGISHGYHTKYSVNNAYRLFSSLLAFNIPANRYFYHGAAETVDVADELGLIVPQEGGLGANAGPHFAYGDPRLKESLVRVFEAQIWRRGNNPSIITWVTGNECYAPWLATAEWLHEIETEISKIDPTRPVTNDRQFDLEGKAMLANPHYPWYGVLPQDAFYYGITGMISAEEMERRKRQIETNPDSWDMIELEGRMSTKFTWNRKQPLWIGEFSWISEQDIPGFFAAQWGEDVQTYRPAFTWHNWSFGSLAGLAKQREFLFTGYRQCGVNAFHAHCWPFVQWETLAPKAVFTREADKQFYGKNTVTRNLSIHNDSFDKGKFTVIYGLYERWNGGKYAEGSFTLHLNPYETAWKKIDVPLPGVKERTDVIFRLSLNFEGGRVYGRDYFWEVVPADESDALKKELGRVYLYDTTGVTADAFKKLGIRHTLLKDFKELPALPGNAFLVVGQDSLDRYAKDNSSYLLEMADNGLSILFLGQNYLGKTEPVSFGHYAFDYPARPVYASAAYPVYHSHPVLKDFVYEDFSYWGDDHVVAFEPFNLPSKGNFRPLILTNVQNESRGLTMPALMEIPRKNGSIYFCQMDIVRKAGRVPAADQLLLQILEYGKPREKFGKNFYVVETKDGPLSSAFRHNFKLNFAGSEKLPEAMDDYGLIFLGERDEKLRDEISAGMEKIKKRINRGMVLYVLNLKDADRKWFENLIEGTMSVRLQASTQAEKINYDPLTDGMTNEQLLWAMFSAVPLDKRQPHPLDIVRHSVSIVTGYKAVPLIFPHGWWKIEIGGGFVFVDNSRWVSSGFPSADRAASILLTNMGVEISEVEKKSVEKTDYSEALKGYKTFSVGLKSHVNWHYADETPVKPGWIGHGPYRDLRDIPKGKVEFLGMPFYVLSPAEAKDGNTIISLYRSGLPDVTEEIPVNRKVDMLVFLHSAAWVQAKDGDTLMRYRIRYDKDFIPPNPPPEEIVEVKRGFHIDDWWFVGVKPDFKLTAGELAWEKSFSGHRAGIFFQIWKNPDPLTPVKWIKAEASKNAQVFVFAVTGVHKN